MFCRCLPKKQIQNKPQGELWGPDLDLPLAEASIGYILVECLRRTPPKSVVLVEADTSRSLTAAEFLSKIVGAAKWFTDIGIKKLDYVLLVLSNGIEVNIALYAIFAIGAVPCVLDDYLTSYEFEHYLKLVLPKFLLAESRLLPAIQEALTKINLNPKLIDVDGSSKDSNLSTFLECLVKTPTKEEVKTFQAARFKDLKNTPGLVVFSSGTTGLPKGIVLPQKSGVYTCLLFKKVKFGANLSVVLQISQLYWLTGILMLYACTSCGIKRVILKSGSATEFMKAIEKYKVEMTILPPIKFKQVARSDEAKKYDLSSFNTVYIAGSTMPKGSLDAIKESFPNVTLINTYGSSELGGSVSQSKEGMEIQSAGVAVPNSRIRFYNTNTGKLCAPNEEGEIHAMHPCMYIGYLNDKAATKNANMDGWFKTGDLGYYTPDENIYITGRAKETFKIDVDMVSPAEIEDVISALHSVKDVGVVALTEDHENRLVALVAKEKNEDVDEETIKKAVASKLSAYKHVKEVIFVDEIPRNRNGKLLRKQLQLLAEARQK